MSEKKEIHIPWAFIGQALLTGVCSVAVMFLWSINSEIKQLRESYSASTAQFSTKIEEHDRRLNAQGEKNGDQDKALADHEKRISLQEARRL